MEFYRSSGKGAIVISDIVGDEEYRRTCTYRITFIFPILQIFFIVAFYFFDIGHWGVWILGICFFVDIYNIIVTLRFRQSKVVIQVILNLGALLYKIVAPTYWIIAIMNYR